jgi:hypothetical protein
VGPFEGKKSSKKEVLPLMAKYTDFKTKKSRGGISGSTVAVIVVFLGLAAVGFFMYKKGFIKIDALRARQVRYY